jgi:hypothetical protein
MSIQEFKKRFGTKMVYQNLPFVYFLALLGILYIANVHYAERNIRQIQTLKQELKESRWKYMSIKSGVMYQSIPSQVAKNVADIDMALFKEKPKKIKYKGKID